MLKLNRKCVLFRGRGQLLLYGPLPLWSDPEYRCNVNHSSPQNIGWTFGCTIRIIGLGLHYYIILSFYWMVGKFQNFNLLARKMGTTSFFFSPDYGFHFIFCPPNLWVFKFLSRFIFRFISWFKLHRLFKYKKQYYKGFISIHEKEIHLKIYIAVPIGFLSEITYPKFVYEARILTKTR